MKKVLLGTSALIAAAAISAPAMAQEQIQLGIGGKMEQYFGVMSLDEATGEERSTTGIDTDVEVYFTGATTLDNGLTVGAVIQLGGEVNASETGAGEADEQYAYIEGAFGRIQAGEKNGVHGDLAHIAPAVGLGIGDIDDWTGDYGQFARGAANNGGYAVVDTTSTTDLPSITYITPTLAGFSAGVSFQPDMGARTANENTTANSRWQAAVAYNGEFSGVGIGADVGYIHHDLSDNFGTANPTLNDDLELWRAGLVVSYAGFQFGGSYKTVDTASASWNGGAVAADVEDRVWDLGVAYETGPYGVSLTYANVDREITNAAAAVNQENEYQQLSLQGSYTMGPGINLVGAAFWADTEQDDNNAATTNDINADGTGFIAGLALSF